MVDCQVDVFVKVVIYVFVKVVDCQAERTYAAIGWGGHTTSSSSYSTGVSVLLRKRRTVRTKPRLEVKMITRARWLKNDVAFECHLVSIFNGITLDWTLMICHTDERGDNHEVR